MKFEACKKNGEEKREIWRLLSSQQRSRRRLSIWMSRSLNCMKFRRVWIHGSVGQQLLLLESKGMGVQEDDGSEWGLFGVRYNPLAVYWSLLVIGCCGYGLWPGFCVDHARSMSSYLAHMGVLKLEPVRKNFFFQIQPWNMYKYNEWSLVITL